ncbi:hypothetical protein [Brunnivagina elsteri]|uniref:Uncharacterized protein n=1 Tax=Brunnivagina elsteri CCALA 953 TaxID=987040 RepID=A0A2A2TNL2_9CYAN|nr:hypothetical protein [Calothrix elsteri]PAX60043.1 hypothetical protein CK510_04015 [Calothrix elsteri CCALA 953]
MAKRFKSLNAALKYLRAPGAGGTTTTPVNAPAGSQLAEYQEYKSGKKVITYTRDAASKPGQLDEVKILPFAEAATSTDFLLVSFSKRASGQFSATGLTALKLNHRTTGDGANAIGFTPARATVTIAATTAGTSTPSKITGRTYQKKNNNSYTFPFGQGESTLVSYKAVKADILSAVATGGTNRSVSFRTEVYR